MAKKQTPTLVTPINAAPEKVIPPRRDFVPDPNGSVTPVKSEPTPAQSMTVNIKDLLALDVNLLRGLSFSTDEVEKFGLVIFRVSRDLMDCINALTVAEQAALEKQKAEQEAEQHANADAE